MRTAPLKSNSEQFWKFLIISDGFCLNRIKVTFLNIFNHVYWVSLFQTDLISFNSSFKALRLIKLYKNHWWMKHINLVLVPFICVWWNRSITYALFLRQRYGGHIRDHQGGDAMKSYFFRHAMYVSNLVQSLDMWQLHFSSKNRNFFRKFWFARNGDHFQFIRAWNEDSLLRFSSHQIVNLNCDMQHVSAINVCDS